MLSISAWASLNVFPPSAKPGDTVTLVIGGKCSDAEKALATFRISGNGVTIDASSLKTGECALSANVSLSKDAAYGSRLVQIEDKDGKILSQLEFEVRGEAAGPIPSGINPQVDVMWNVLSEKACADQLGLRVARRYYCIEVMVGNNSGYALLIASVGFARQIPGLDYRESSVTYLNVRSALWTEQVIGGRNIAHRTIQGAASVVAGFIPLQKDETTRGNLGLWGTALGLFATAFDAILPDRTVRQLVNLDDAALRDGRLIPNNSPVRFTVFVERDSIKPLLLPLSERVSYELEELTSVKKDLDLRAASVTGPRKDEIVAQSKKVQTTIDTLKNLPKTDPPPKPIDQQGEKKNPILGRYTLPNERDLVKVRRALGSLILVGDQIEYKQRIKVDSSAVNPEAAPSPADLRIKDDQEVKQGADTPVIILGRYLTNSTLRIRNCDNCELAYQLDNSGKFIDVSKLKIPANFTADEIQFVVTNGSAFPGFVNAKVAFQKASIDSGWLAQTDWDLKSKIIVKGKYLAGAKVVSAKMAGAETEDVPFDDPKIESKPDAPEATMEITLKPTDAQKGKKAEVKVVIKTLDGKSHTISVKPKA
jgi:hypothetical protein